jgi:hypothetical protein
LIVTHLKTAVFEGRNPEARELFRQYADSLEFDLEFQGFSQELATLPGKYAPPEGCILLAEESGHFVGCVALRPLDKPSYMELEL